MSEVPRRGDHDGVPSDDGAGFPQRSPWVHQDHPRIGDVPRSQATPYEPSYPSAPVEERPPSLAQPGVAAWPASAPQGWPAPSGYPTPVEADPYGIRGQPVVDEPSWPPSGAWGPGAWPPEAGAARHAAHFVPAPRHVVGADADPWQPWAMTAEERTWAPAAHWLPLLTSWLGPLVVLLTVGERNARVRECAKESLNFEITFALAVFLSVLLVFVGVGLVLLVVLPIVWLVWRITAAVRVSRGAMYRYAIRIRFLR